MRKKITIIEDDNLDFIFKIATEREELEQAYRLLHDVYVNTGYTDPKSSGIRLNKFFASPNATTLIGKIENLVVITGTIFPDSVLGLPMDSLYSNKLNKIRNKGRNIGEIGALASHPSYRRGNQMLPMFLNKIMRTYGREYLKLDDIVITVNPKHEAFYKKILLFNPIGKNKHYEAVNGHVAVPLRLNFVKMPQSYHKAYKNAPRERNLEDFFFHRKSEAIKLPPEKKPQVIWHENLFRHFFIDKTNLLSSLDHTTQDLLSELYASYPGIKELINKSKEATSEKTKSRVHG